MVEKTIKDKEETCHTLEIMDDLPDRPEGQVPQKRRVKGKRERKERSADSLEISKSADEKLISILKDPSCTGLAVSKICKLADISRTTYYNLFKNMGFIRSLEQEAQELLVRNDLPVLHNIATKAGNPEVTSHHWAQMFMKMRGRLSDQPVRPAQINLVFNVDRPPKIVSIVEDIIDVSSEAENSDN